MTGGEKDPETERDSGSLHLDDDLLSDEDRDMIAAEAEVAASLKNALEQLRGASESLGQLTSEERVEAAEKIARDAAQLDEELGSAAREAGTNDAG